MLFKYSNNFSLKAKNEFCISETNENIFEILYFNHLKFLYCVFYNEHPINISFGTCSVILLGKIPRNRIANLWLSRPNMLILQIILKGSNNFFFHPGLTLG